MELFVTRSKMNAALTYQLAANSFPDRQEEFAMLCYSIEMAAPDQVRRRRVLLIEDDDIPRRNYDTLLSSHRLTVHTCATKFEALAAFDREMFDVVILDVTLGGEYEAGRRLVNRPAPE